MSRSTFLDSDLIADVERTINLTTTTKILTTQTPLHSVIDIEYIKEKFYALKELGITSVDWQRLFATYLLGQAALLTSSTGDFVETGVFKGGSTSVLMNLLIDFDKKKRKCWAFDSFDGLPSPVTEDTFGIGHKGNKGGYNSSRDVFVENMKTFKAWDEKRLVVTPGWFSETCAKSPVKSISFLRLDGDMFASTWDAITAFYDRVVPGGYIYVDDYGSFNGCRAAINKFRTMRKIYEPLMFIRQGKSQNLLTFEAVWWKKRIGYPI